MLRILLIVACVLAGGPAWAHAVLLESLPADGAALDKGPPAIVLRFNEPVAPVSIRLLDATGAERAVTAPRAENNEVRLELPDLPGGGYIVSWRVVSGDSHPIAGGLVFTVGGFSLPGPFASPDARREAGWTTAIMVNRLVLYAALIFAAGGTLFGFLVLRPLRVEVDSFAEWRLRAVFVAALAAILAVGLKGGQLSALPAASLLQPSTWRLGLTTSTADSALLVVLGLGVMAGTGYWRRLWPWLEPAGAVAALLGLSATGHAASGQTWVQLVAAVHALLVAFWLGAFWPLLRLIPGHPAATLGAAQRFSRFAVPAVLALTASGVAMALSRIADLAQLVGAPYGQLLIVKLLMVTALLVVAATNRWHTTPALAAGKREAPAEFARNLWLEIGLGAAVLLLTAVLAHTPPPGMAADSHRHKAEAEPGYAIWVNQRNRALLLELTPALRGPNALTARFSSAAGDPLTPQEVTVSFAHAASGVEPIIRPLTRGRNGVFRLGRIDLPLGGTWTVRVEALIDDFEKAVFEVEMPVSAARPRRSS